jgi:hypothetical protein
VILSRFISGTRKSGGKTWESADSWQISHRWNLDEDAGCLKKLGMWRLRDDGRFKKFQGQGDDENSEFLAGDLSWIQIEDEDGSFYR